MRKGKLLLGAALLGAAGEFAIASYFYRRTMLRSNAKRDRTQKMAGTDWDRYIPTIRDAKEWLAGQPQEEIWVTSEDGLKLYGRFFPCGSSAKTVLCLHGYTSEGLNDYSTLARFYLEHGFN